MNYVYFDLPGAHDLPCVLACYVTAHYQTMCNDSLLSYQVHYFLFGHGLNSKISHGKDFHSLSLPSYLVCYLLPHYYPLNIAHFIYFCLHLCLHLPLYSLFIDCFLLIWFPRQ